VQRWSKGRGAKEKHKRGEQVAAGAHPWASCVTHPHKVTSCLGPPFSSFFSSSFFGEPHKLIIWAKEIRRCIPVIK
jgi:hypothetical protein